VVDDKETQDGGLLLALIDSTTPVQSDSESDTESDIGSEDETQHPPSPQQPSPRHMMLTFFHMIRKKGFLFQDIMPRIKMMFGEDIS
jgi:hypothetical protein